MADLHVLDALRERQCYGPHNPSSPRSAAANKQARHDVKRPLELNGATDIGRVSFTERLNDFATNGIEFVSEGIDLGLTEMSVCSDVGNGQEMSR
jgi:hypothetical protein